MPSVDRYRIAMVSSHNVRDPNIFSGAGHYIYKALERSVGDVRFLPPLFPSGTTCECGRRHTWRRCRNWWYRNVRRIYNLGGINYQWERQHSLSMEYARHYQRLLADSEEEYDFIFADKGSVQIAHLETSIPILYSCDCTFAALEDYYDKYSNMLKRTIEQGHTLERMAIKRADACLFRSEWAAKSAIEDYGADPAKVFVTLFGPNMDEKYIPRRISRPGRPAQRQCNLLLVGVDWRRKGCDIAIEATRILRSRNIDARLTICGCRKKSRGRLPDFVDHIRFLDKQKPEDVQRLTDLYSLADFFIFPTQAEAFGIVLLEACAFGVPIIAARTGGVPAIVRHEQNGLLVDQIQDPRAYAAAIQRALSDSMLYQRCAAGARTFYEKQGNWQAWADRVREAMNYTIGRRQTGHGSHMKFA